MAVYFALAAAAVVALWTARSKGRVFARPVVLPLLAVASLVPAAWQSLYVSAPARVPFFATSLYKTCIPQNETLAVFPFGYEGGSMLWQAEADFRFRLAEGYVAPVVSGATSPSSFDADPTVQAIYFLSDQGHPTTTALLAFAGRHGIGRFVSVVGDGYPTESQLRSLGSVQQVGGVLVAPACGRPPLTARPQTAAVLLLDKQEETGVTIGYCRGGYYYGLPAGIHPAGSLQGARPALFIAGKGLSCSPPPAGYKRRGLAPARLGVTGGTYPYYAP